MGGFLGQHLQARETREDRLQGGADCHPDRDGCREIREVQAGKARFRSRLLVAPSPQPADILAFMTECAHRQVPGIPSLSLDLAP